MCGDECRWVERRWETGLRGGTRRGDWGGNKDQGREGKGDRGKRREKRGGKEEVDGERE